MFPEVSTDLEQDYYWEGQVQLEVFRSADAVNTKRGDGGVELR
jgi:hypothetical protein